ncbi:MAG: AAA family ATPase [Candidatus Magnetoovum sp. WYHC-5]|nr:AAA family ATPase [Candidatus Magnetoovum sp. WYHC-5]
MEEERVCEHDNANDFEKCVIEELKRVTFRNVELTKKHNDDYDIEIASLTSSLSVAIQIKLLNRPAGMKEVTKFLNFLEKPIASRFNFGCFISGSSFTRQVLSYISRENIRGFYLGKFEKGVLYWLKNGHWSREIPYGMTDKDRVFYDDDSRYTQDTTNNHIKEIYIGVFTCKGGVGKTTVAAHLAGAFAETGYNVILLDLDNERNLKKLLGNGVKVPSYDGNDDGTAVSVLSYEEWLEKKGTSDYNIIICDCNPNFESNPMEMIKRFNYCIVPTTLNPLGVQKNADVILRTFRNIRTVNTLATMFVLINSFHREQSIRNKQMNNYLKLILKKATRDNPKYHYIDPSDVAIRYSLQLVYWGYEHLFLKKNPELAFNKVGGRSYPREDFFSLVEYLMENTDIDKTSR